MRGFIFVFITVCIALARPAYAGDAAERLIIGFSKDGRYFAFTEYGVQDGSGFAYATTFVLDLDEDAWVEGSPFSVLDENEHGRLDVVLPQVKSKAQSLLDDLKIVVPGFRMASNPIGEVTGDPLTLTFRSHRDFGPDQVLKLETYPLTKGSTCDLFGDTKGFALSFGKAGEPLIDIHRDTHLPQSRRCPINYALGDVIAHDMGDGALRLVALVHSFTYGFEGPDVRYLAVPIN